MELPDPTHNVGRVGAVDPALERIVGNHLKGVVEGVGKLVVVILIAGMVVANEYLAAD